MDFKSAFETITKGDPTTELSPEFALLVERLSLQSQILALGEAYHTSDGFYVAKINIFKHLIERDILKVVAFENPWAESKLIQAYVSGADVPFNELPTKLFMTWRSKSIAAFLKWLREFNLMRPLHERVIFFGFDIQKPGISSLETIRQFCKNYALNDAATLGLSSFSPLLEQAEADRFLDQLSAVKLLAHHPIQNIQKDLLNLIEALDSIECFRSELSPDDLDLRVCIICVSYFLRFIVSIAASSLLGPELLTSLPTWKPQHEVRDQGMFLVFEAIFRSLGQRKTGLWAHNLHILMAGEQTSIYPVKSMGSYLNQTFGEWYFPIALIAHEIFLNWHWIPQMKDLKPPVPQDGCCESILKNIDSGPCYIDLADKNEFPSNAGIFDFHPVERLNEQFRGLIYLDKSPAMEYWE
jgi:erythromycin esterase-like protein